VSKSWARHRRRQGRLNDRLGSQSRNPLIPYLCWITVRYSEVYLLPKQIAYIYIIIYMYVNICIYIYMNHHFSRILLFSRFVGFLKSNWLIGCQPITVGEKRWPPWNPWNPLWKMAGDSMGKSRTEGFSSHVRFYLNHLKKKRIGIPSQLNECTSREDRIVPHQVSWVLSLWRTPARKKY